MRSMRRASPQPNVLPQLLSCIPFRTSCTTSCGLRRRQRSQNHCLSRLAAISMLPVDGARLSLRNGNLQDKVLAPSFDTFPRTTACTTRNFVIQALLEHVVVATSRLRDAENKPFRMDTACKRHTAVKPRPATIKFAQMCEAIRSVLLLHM